MKIKITSDSTCDLTQELLDRFHIDTVPLYVIMDGVSYRDSMDITTEQIFAHVAAGGALCSTSAVSENDYIEFFTRELQDCDGLVHVTLSSKMSVCYQNACNAARRFEHVQVVDSLNLSSAQGLIVMEGAELAQDPVVSARLDYSQRSSKLDKLRAGAHITSFDRKLYGGVLTDLGCYVLHFAVNLFGAPKKLDASAVFLGEVDGTDVLTLHYDGFDVSVTVSKCAHSMIGSEIQCDRATYTLKNLSVVLGVEKHTMDTCEEYDCGISCPGWPIANAAMLPGVQERVVRRFDRWVRGEDLAAQQRLLQQSLTVQRLIEEAHRQIGY